MVSLKESLRRKSLTPKVVSISPANPFGFNLDFDIDKWAEGYVRELEEHMNHTRPNGLITQEAYWFGYKAAVDEVSRFLRGKTK